MIDPQRLEQQRLAVVKPGSEYYCPKCGRRTRDKRGACSGCWGAKVPDLRRLSNEGLSGLLAACRAELERRRAEIDRGLGRET